MNLIESLKTAERKRPILTLNGVVSHRWEEITSRPQIDNGAINPHIHSDYIQTGVIGTAPDLFVENTALENLRLTAGSANVINTGIATIRQAPVELTDETIDMLINRLMERMEQR